MMRIQALSMGDASAIDSKTPEHYAIAAVLALTGVLNPGPFPLTGLHKFYAGQPLWGGIYLILGWTHISRIACAIDGLWYLLQYYQEEPSPPLPLVRISTQTAVMASQQTQAIAIALRELEKLRQEGLISEDEFEQKRRNLLDKLG